jgi:aminopeptidase
MCKTDKVRITAKNTDLSFSIKGIGAESCGGKHNIPDGEVFSCPVKDSVEGYVSFNAPTIYDGVAFDNIRLEFKKGKIVSATGSDSKRLNEILDTDEGGRYLGEFAIGFNPFITKPMRDILFDEKITGSLHLTPGCAYETAGNGNQSAIHWDMVLLQTPEHGGGEIWLDDVLIRKDGLFVPLSLQALNPANLLSI